MKKKSLWWWLLAALALGFIMLAAPCGKEATPPGGTTGNGGTTGGPPSKDGCDSHAECTTKAGEICDFMFPKTSPAKKGTCHFACNPLEQTPCSHVKGTNVCNPISAACEPADNCGTVENCAKIGNFQAQCVNGYCAILADSNKCPDLFKVSAGLCKLELSQFPKDTKCPGNLVLDAVTGTCEVGCTIGERKCQGIDIARLTEDGFGQTFLCSSITSTCVQDCAGPKPPETVACQYQKRSTCLKATLGTTTIQTCERLCTQLSDCRSGNICKVTAVSSSDDKYCQIDCKGKAEGFCPAGMKCLTDTCIPSST
ncbi:MAG: hypothetical protein JKY15_04615 [Deltaproteobacteria bacterium]|nr:hypothetical protein [Deltaproteobacteria bacterium]